MKLYGFANFVLRLVPYGFSCHRSLYVVELWNWSAYHNRLLNKNNCWLTGYLKEYEFAGKRVILLDS